MSNVPTSWSSSSRNTTFRYVGLPPGRGLLTLLGLWVAGWAAGALQNSWPLSPTHTLGLLLVGASIPAGAFIQSVGGWRKRGVLLAAGVTGFLIGSYLL